MLERQVTREATTTQQILRVFLWTFLPSCLATWADCPCRSLLLLGLPGPLFSLRILGMTTLLPFVLQIRGGGGESVIIQKTKTKKSNRLTPVFASSTLRPSGGSCFCSLPTTLLPPAPLLLGASQDRRATLPWNSQTQRWKGENNGG